MRRRDIPALLLSVLAAGAPLARTGEARPLTVLAAASMTDVLREIGDAWTAQGGPPVRFSFASTAALARQVESGAPADVFVSADREWMDYLDQRSLIDRASRTEVAGNRIVLVAQASSATSVRLARGVDLRAALGDRGRLVMADPAAVPAGRYGREALVALGAWPLVQARLVPADNVRTALNFVARGEAPLGIVYATDARAEPRVRVVDTFPADSHPPIAYPAAALRGARPEGERFVRFLAGPEARRIFEGAGFSVPPDARGRGDR